MAKRITFAEYQLGLNQSKFLGMQCRGCGEILFPALAVCSNCGGVEMDRHELAGQGVLRTFTVVRVAPIGFTPPYTVAMVELDEGPWVIGNLVELDPNEAGLELVGCKVALGSQSIPPETSGLGSIRALTFTLIGN